MAAGLLGRVTRTLTAAGVLGLALGAAQAAPAGVDYLAPGQIDPAITLPPPPAAGSAQAVAEIAELKGIAASRSAEAEAAAARDDKDEAGDMFAFQIGRGFDLAKLPATARLLADIGATEEDVSKPAKTVFQRPRPWIVIPGWTTCTPHKPGPALNSYPSGHATVAYAMGVVLARLMPDKAQAILARAAQFAENRLVCGVHFRSDIAAGQVLGTVIAVDLIQAPGFQADYDAAAAELAAAHLR